jgi:hypothetical protein
MALQISMLPLCKRNSSADTFPSYFCLLLPQALGADTETLVRCGKGPAN